MDVTNSVFDALTKGNRLDMLTAQLEKLAKQIDICESARDLPALTKRFNEVYSEREAYKSMMDKKQDTPLLKILNMANHD